MTFCTNCGKKLSSGATKCEDCGTVTGVTDPASSKSPGSGNQQNTDALKTRISGQGGSGDSPAGSGSTATLTPAIGSQSGRVLGGRYKLEQCIGSGGMGEIYRARRMHIGDTVAVKVLRADVVENEKSRQRFYREARAAAMLHHPNAVVIHDFGEDDDGTTYIVMELLEGRSLRQLLIEEGTVSPIRAFGVIRQTCAALDAGHRNGIVHRDIKPDNIILLDSHDGADHVKILDFGIAKVLDKAIDTLSFEQRLTNVGTIIGTPHYMAPEQCQGEEADARSDIYSLGVVLYELLTGVAPFVAKTPTGVAIKHVTEKPRPLNEIKPGIPESVERVVLHALEKDPNTRPQTALELARELEVALAGEPDTLRFSRTGEQPKVDVAPPPSTPSAEISRESAGVQPPSTAGVTQQSYDTVVTPQSDTDRLERSSEVVTDKLAGSGEPATELLGQARNTGEQRGPASGLKTQAIEQTQLLEEAQPPAVAEPPPSSEAETARFKTRAAADELPPADPGLAAAGRNLDFQQPEPKPAAAPPPIPRPVSAPAAKSKLPLLAGAGLIVIAVIGIALWQFRSGESQSQPASTATVASSPAAAASPSPSPASVYPEVAAPEGMVYVLGGALRIGRDDGAENERPAHTVTVKPFFIDRLEVANEQYLKFIDQTGYPAPPSWKDNLYAPGAEKFPVTDVTWEDANAYAKWAGKRLPTEEEWEFAARGPDDRRIYPWGETWLANAANIKADKDDQRQLAPVGQFPAGASPFGLLDMLGNVWEWTASDYNAYPGGTIEMRPNYTNRKVIRGGSYDTVQSDVSATFRVGWPATRKDWPRSVPADYPKYLYTGFRLAQDVKPQ